MTVIKRRLKPVWHQTGIIYDGRPLCVAETPAALLCRRKGTRLTLMVPWNVAYLRGATLAAQSMALAKAQKRRKAKAGVSRGSIRF